MKRTKALTTTPVIMLIAGILAGLFLLLKPGATLGAVIRIVGWALIIDGILKAMRMLMNGKRNFENFRLPAIEILGGIAFMAAARLLIRLIPIAVGLILIMLGVYKAKSAFNIKNSSNGKQWMLLFAFAVASAVVGVYVLVHPAGFTQTVIRILGGYLLIECAEDLYAYYLAK